MDRAHLAGHDAAKYVDFVAARCRDQQLCVFYAGFLQNFHRGSVSLDSHHIHRLLTGFQDLGVAVDNNDVMPVLRKTFSKPESDFSVSDNDDFHLDFSSAIKNYPYFSQTAQY